MAVSAGAELVLSVNGSNRAMAVDWGVEVVAIPDHAGSLDGLDETVEFLAVRACRFVSTRLSNRSGLGSPPRSSVTSRSVAVIPRRR